MTHEILILFAEVEIVERNYLFYTRYSRQKAKAITRSLQILNLVFVVINCITVLKITLF
jgi:hypothetical protein